MLVLSKRPSLNCLIHFYKRCVSRKHLCFQTLFRTEESPLKNRKENISKERDCCNSYFLKVANIFLMQQTWTVEFVVRRSSASVV